VTYNVFVWAQQLKCTGQRWRHLSTEEETEPQKKEMTGHRPPIAARTTLRVLPPHKIFIKNQRTRTRREGGGRRCVGKLESLLENMRWQNHFRVHRGQCPPRMKLPSPMPSTTTGARELLTECESLHTPEFSVHKELISKTKEKT
jgi:hypothetical protein